MAYLKTIFTDAKKARDYIQEFISKFPKTIHWVDTSSGRRIYIHKMTDVDAIFIANEFVSMKSESFKKGKK